LRRVRHFRESKGRETWNGGRVWSRMGRS
jgi:hypothetical protein